MAFEFVPDGERLRPLVEAHVKQIYRRTYGARISSFPDLMVADIGESRTVRCAAGLRCDADGFFSECYLDAPLEKVLSSLTPDRIGRERIIEVTSLASSSTCSAARLIENIIRFARRIGTDWAVFTITPRLRQLLLRMGLPIVVLGPADPSRVEDPEAWGRYYECGPFVAAMHDPGPATLALSRSAVAPAPIPLLRGHELDPAHG